jgi:hypothetical protein
MMPDDLIPLYSDGVPFVALRSDTRGDRMGRRPTRKVDVPKPLWTMTARRPPTEMMRCPYCGMAYDGAKHENCPHCLAPRTVEEVPCDIPKPTAPPPYGLVSNNECRRLGFTKLATDDASSPDHKTFGDLNDRRDAGRAMVASRVLWACTAVSALAFFMLPEIRPLAALLMFAQLAAISAFDRRKGKAWTTRRSRTS